MSWQAYVDTNLVGTGTVTAAGIYDLQGNPWAYSAGFAVSAPPARRFPRPRPPSCPLTTCTRPAQRAGRAGGEGGSGGAGRRAGSRLGVSTLPPPYTAQAQVAEVAAVSAHFAAPAGLAATGVTVAGVKYMFVRGEENEVIQCKKVGTNSRPHPRPSPPPCGTLRGTPHHTHTDRAVPAHPCSTLVCTLPPPLCVAPQGAEGVYFYRCNTCIIVAHHNDKVQPGNCLATVAKLGDFLKEQGI